jgi:hypothetical protein
MEIYIEVSRRHYDDDSPSYDPSKTWIFSEYIFLRQISGPYIMQYSCHSYLKYSYSAVSYHWKLRHEIPYLRIRNLYA